MYSQLPIMFVCPLVFLSVRAAVAIGRPCSPAIPLRPLRSRNAPGLWRAVLWAPSYQLRLDSAAGARPPFLAPSLRSKKGAGLWRAVLHCVLIQTATHRANREHWARGIP